MNTEKEQYYGISLDFVNRVEYIRYTLGDTIINTEEALGSFILGTSESFSQYCDYYELDSEKEKILSLIDDDFIEKQRRIGRRQRNAYYVIGETVSDMNVIFIGDKTFYSVSDGFTALARIYLDVLYTNSLYPRMCKRCRRKFLAKTHIFEVLCSDTCKEQSKKCKAEKYKDSHNDEYEALYMKVYQRWYTRIRRGKEKGTLSGEKLEMCDNLFFQFAEESTDKRNYVRSGIIAASDYEYWISCFEQHIGEIMEQE